MVKGFFTSWTELTFSSVFDSTNDYDYEIKDKLLRVSYNQDGLDITNYLNNMVDLDSIIYKDGFSITKMYPVFEKTSFNKKFLKTLNTIGDGFELKMEVIYKDFDKIKIPHIINTFMKFININQTSQIEFTNIKLL